MDGDIESMWRVWWEREYKQSDIQIFWINLALEWW